MYLAFSKVSNSALLQALDTLYLWPEFLISKPLLLHIFSLLQTFSAEISNHQFLFATVSLNHLFELLNLHQSQYF
jgi:hypothetical protein